MPTYDYRCDSCEHEFELFQSIKDDPIKKCPECGKPKVRRLFGTGAAIMFKGSGFYKTDYRSESYRKRAAEETKSSDGAGSPGKSETKPDSGSKTKGDSGGKSKEKPSP
jgi:putative FmdB family regulatory protein